MPSIRIHKLSNSGIYYLTLTVIRWYYLFDRHNRWQILLDSLKYCQQHKQLKIYAWVFMLNHIHLLIESPDTTGFLRDFKSFTTNQIIKNIFATEPDVFKIFKVNGKSRIWQSTNMPELVETRKFFEQKVTYIEYNPVRKGYVLEPDYWIWSSANPEKLLELTLLEP